MKKIAILHGPNLNRLGKREPEIYGTATLRDLEQQIRTEARALGFSPVFFQSNHEGALIDEIHRLADAGIEGFIVNFGAYSHTSIALRDALSSTSLPAVEVHISDIKQREKFRHQSMTAGACVAMISGKGFFGYTLALRRLTKV
jgi:3-dehydroquinate dehydratase-2